MAREMVVVRGGRAARLAGAPEQACPGVQRSVPLRMPPPSAVCTGPLPGTRV
jgi:hypothetical protein